MRKHRFDALLRAVALVAALAALTGGVAACGGSDKSSETTAGASTTAGGKTINVAFFTALGNTYLEATYDGLRRGFAGKDVAITPFDSQFDSQKQYGQIQDAIASGKFDAFVIFPVDGNAIVPLMKQASDAGIAVIDTDFPIGPRFDAVDPQAPGVAGSVLLPAVDSGKALGDMTVAACRGHDPCKVALLPGFLGSPFDTAALGAIRDVIGSHPEIQVVATQEGRLLAAPALAAAQNILQANPDLNVFTTIGDQMASGAERAVRGAGKDGIAIIGEAASEVGVQAVRDGRWYGTTVALPGTEGEVAAQMVLQSAAGGISPRGVNPVEKTGLPSFVSKDNLSDVPADFRGEWKG
jgi:ribose transport system substrate-binding protein